MRAALNALSGPFPASSDLIVDPATARPIIPRMILAIHVEPECSDPGCP